MSPGAPPPQMSLTENTYPGDFSTATMNSKVTTVTVCPSCHHISASTSTDPLSIHPLRCNYRRGPKYTGGVRWTEFVRLPYVDPPKILVIDSMHNSFLGPFKERFRNVLAFGFDPPPSYEEAMGLYVAFLSHSHILPPYEEATTTLDA